MKRLKISELLQLCQELAKTAVAVSIILASVAYYLGIITKDELAQVVLLFLL